MRWSRRGLLVLALALSAGCDDGAAPAAAPDVAPALEAGPPDGRASDGAVDRGVALDQTVDGEPPDAGAPDQGPAGELGPPPPPVRSACGPTAPALLDDLTVYVDGQRVALASAFGGAAAFALADATALAPLVAPGQPLEAPAVFVPLIPAAGGCEVVALDRRAGPVWRQAIEGANGCTRPALADGHLLLSVATAQGGAAVLLDRATGAERARVALPGAPTTDVVRLATERAQNGGSHWLPAPEGLAANGGSHWLVGVGEHLVDLGWGDDAAPALAVRTRVRLGAFAMALAPVGPGRLAIAARRRAADPGYGDQILRWTLRVEAEAAELAEAGAPIDTGAPLQAPLVGAADCDDRVANGGSHWWCPDGLLVGAGQDWLAGWRWSDGALVGRAVKALHSTGVVIGDDGKIFNGGSHWRGAAEGWALLSADLRAPEVEPTVLAEGQRGQTPCVAPVAADPGGRLDLLVTGGGGPTLTRLPSLAGGLAPGWARPGGDNAGAGGPVSPVAGCGGGAPRFRRPLVQAEGRDGRAGAVGPGGVFLGLPDPQGGPPAVAALDPMGRVRWIRTVPPPQGQATLGWAAMAPLGDGVAAVAEFELAGRRAVRLLVLGGAGDIVVDRALDDGQGRLPTALATFADGGLAVAILASQPGIEPEFALVRLGADLAGDAQVLPLPAETYPEALAAVGQDLVLVGSFGPGPGAQRDGFVMRLDAQGGELWRDTLEDAAAQVVVQAVGASPAGDLLVAGVRFAGVTEPFVRRYAAEGAILTQDAPPEPLGRYVGVTLSERGLGVVQDEFGQWVDVLPGGAVGDVGEAFPDAEFIAHTLAAPPGGGRVVLGVHFTPEDFVPTPVVIRQGGFGHAGCVEAGRCAGVEVEGCLGPNLCEIGVCEPDSGLCAGRRVVDGAPCGEGVCERGLCMAP
ncbi:MAG: hypothetical protein H6702_11130 [Myxococcales bacterium]|nr:hypothetical protein [Myxococcales bacterium]